MDFNKFNAILAEKTHIGRLEDANQVSTMRNEACGDDYQLYLKINDNDVIEKAKVVTSGCNFSIVALSLAVKYVEGKTIHEAKQLSEEIIGQGVDGFPPRRSEYPHTAVKMILSAIKDYEGKKTKIEVGK